MIQANILVKGRQINDVILALEESLRLIDEGFIMGNNSNDDGAFDFEVHYYENTELDHENGS